MDDMGRSVLIISYFFPPVFGAGGMRVLGFAKWLPAFGWRPIILTTQGHDRYLDGIMPEDDASGQLVYRARHVLRLGWLKAGLAKYAGLRNSFQLPDAYVGWIPVAVLSILRVARRENARVILASCPPFTTALAASIGSRLLKIPLVLDYRDLWTSNPYKDYSSSLHRMLDQLLEKACWVATGAIVTTTKSSRRALRLSIDATDPPVKVIYNGIDGLPVGQEPDKFTALYAGSFYGSRQPDDLFRAAGLLKKESLVSGADFQIRLLTPERRSLFESLDRLQVADLVEVKGVVSHREALKEISNAHMLILIQGTAQVDNIVPVARKTFEYLSSGSPILLVSPKGENVELIQRYSRTSTWVHPGDVEGIKGALLRQYRRWAGGENLRDMGQAKRVRLDFSTKHGSQKLARLLDDVLGSVEVEPACSA